MNRHRLSIYPALVTVAIWLLLATVACSGNQRTLPDVLFLNEDAAGVAQLYRQQASSSEPEQVTTIAADEPGIAFFRLSPDTTAVVYATEPLPGGSELRLIDLESGKDSLLLACPEAACSEIVWAPDSRRLVYERRDRSQAAAGAPALWWLDAGSGRTVPVIAGDEVPAYGASFSPDGRWLGYVSPAQQGVIVASLEGDSQRSVDSRTGMPPVWANDSEQMLVSDLHLVVVHGEEGDDHDTHTHEFQTATLLFNVGSDSEERHLLSPELLVDDGSPVYSPDGEWIVFGRRPANTASGRQLWLMRADGSEARPLTSEPSVQHGAPQWSPDGQWILHQRYDGSEPGTLPSVWMLEVATGTSVQLSAAGYMPAWIASN